jgi:hypothetical protein
MASNLHKDLTDLQLHVPKGFAGASNGTTCQKDATGNLVWAVAGGGGGGSEIDVNSIRGFYNNKSGTFSNWFGYNSAYYPAMSIDFGARTTANIIENWSNIIPASCYHVTSIDPTLIQFNGNVISSTNATIDLSLWYVRPLCLGSTTGTLQHITSISNIASSNVAKCFDITLTQGLLKGDIIIPLAKSSTTSLFTFTGTFRVEQL